MSQSDLSRSAPFRLGVWDVDPACLEVRSDGVVHSLQARTMRVLCLLHAHADETVTKDRISAEIWGEQGASDELIARHISTLRRLFGEDSRAPQLIQTVPRVGYRLTMPPDPSPPAAVYSPPATGTHRPWSMAFFAAAVLALVASAALWLVPSAPPDPPVVGAGGEQATPALFRGDLAVSPVGSQVAYVEGLAPWRGGDLVIVDPVQQVERRLRFGDVRFPGFSPDGSAVAFYRYDLPAGCRLVVWRLDLWNEDWSAPCVGIPTSPVAWRSSERLLEALLQPDSAGSLLLERSATGVSELARTADYLGFPALAADGRVIALTESDAGAAIVALDEAAAALRPLRDLGPVAARWLAVDGPGRRATVLLRPDRGSSLLLELALDGEAKALRSTAHDTSIQSVGFAPDGEGMLYMALRWLPAQDQGTAAEAFPSVQVDLRMIKLQTPLSRVTPDSTRIAFLQREEDSVLLQLVEVDGGDVEVVETLPSTRQIVPPSWSPAGERMIYAHQGDGAAEVVVYDMGERRVLSRSAVPFEPADLQLVADPLLAFVYEQRWGSMVVHRLNLLTGAITPMREVVGAWARVSPDGSEAFLIDSEFVRPGQRPWVRSTSGAAVVDEPTVR